MKSLTTVMNVVPMISDLSRLPRTASVLAGMAVLLLVTACSSVDMGKRDAYEPRTFDRTSRIGGSLPEERRILPRKFFSKEPDIETDSAPWDSIDVKDDREIEWVPVRTDLEIARGQPEEIRLEPSSIVVPSPRDVTPGRVGKGAVVGVEKLEQVRVNLDFSNVPVTAAYLELFAKVKAADASLPYESVQFETPERLTSRVSLQGNDIPAGEAFAQIDSLAGTQARFMPKTIVVSPVFETITPRPQLEVIEPRIFQ